MLQAIGSAAGGAGTFFYGKNISKERLEMNLTEEIVDSATGVAGGVACGAIAYNVQKRLMLLHPAFREGGSFAPKMQVSGWGDFIKAAGLLTPVVAPPETPTFYSTLSVSLSLSVSVSLSLSLSLSLSRAIQETRSCSCSPIHLCSRVPSIMPGSMGRFVENT